MEVAELKRQKKDSEELTDIYDSSQQTWPNLDDRNSKRELNTPPSYNYEIQGFVVLNENIIGVHKRKNILYYDGKTFLQKNNLLVRGHFRKYSENKYALLLLFSNLTLYVNWKIIPDSSSSFISFPKVTLFKILDNVVYYVNLSNELCKCEVIDGVIMNSVVTSLPRQAVALSTNNGFLYVLTDHHGFYELVDNQLVAMVSYSSVNNSNIYQKLKEYNFLQEVDWTELLKKYSPSETQSSTKSRRLTTVKQFTKILSYGSVTFAGTDEGKLYVFRASKIKQCTDLYRAKPLQIYDLRENRHFRELRKYRIIQIEVVVSKQRHFLYVATPKKITMIIIPSEVLKPDLESYPTNPSLCSI